MVETYYGPDYKPGGGGGGSFGGLFLIALVLYAILFFSGGKQPSHHGRPRAYEPYISSYENETKKEIPNPYLITQRGIKECADERIRDAKNRILEKRAKAGEYGRADISTEQHIIEHWEKEKIKADKRFEKYKEQTKQILEKGYLTPKHKYWKMYEKMFGKEDWWPKNSKE